MTNADVPTEAILNPFYDLQMHKCPTCPRYTFFRLCGPCDRAERRERARILYGKL